MRATETVDALILDCTPSGESFLKLFWLSPSAADYALLRESKRKTAARPAPPQQIEMIVESASAGGARFVREWRIVQEWPQLARHYAQFVSWGNLVRFLRPNLSHLSDYGPVHTLLLTTLDALSAGKSAEATELKTLFQFARIEGYPVREEWLANLSSLRRQFATGVLYSPLTTTAPHADETSALITSLKQYLTHVSHLNGDSHHDQQQSRRIPSAP